VGEQWGGPNIGHLYQVLDRRARDGLIESERQPQAVKPDRLVHRITPAGRAELDRWLSEPNVRTRGYRDDFFLKVVAAAQAGDPETLAAALRRHRGARGNEQRIPGPARHRLPGLRRPARVSAVTGRSRRIPRS
jgi:DNA-binding PadR family transcriptional regulator